MSTEVEREFLKLYLKYLRAKKAGKVPELPETDQLAMHQNAIDIFWRGHKPKRDAKRKEKNENRKHLRKS